MMQNPSLKYSAAKIGTLAVAPEGREMLLTLDAATAYFPAMINYFASYRSFPNACFTLLLLVAVTGAAAERTVVLTNGNVLRGQVRQTANQVIVATATGEIRLGSGEVDMVVANLHEAYRKKARGMRRASSPYSSLPASSSKRRAELAKWCLRNGLLAEGLSELDAIRKVDPKSPEISYLTQLVKLATKPKSRTTRLPAQHREHVDVVSARNHMDQLSRPTLSQFVRHVQPLLMNRCATAGCHGKSAESSFGILLSRSRTTPRNVTQRNLGATLKRIGEYPSDQTLLWMSASNPHGELDSAPLNDTELSKLLTWIRRVNKDLGVAETPGSVATASAEIPLAGGADPFDPAGFNSEPAEAE